MKIYLISIQVSGDGGKNFNATSIMTVEAANMKTAIEKGIKRNEFLNGKQWSITAVSALEDDIDVKSLNNKGEQK